MATYHLTIVPATDVISWLVEPIGAATVLSVNATTDVVSWRGNLTMAGAPDYVLTIDSTTDVISWVVTPVP